MFLIVIVVLAAIIIGSLLVLMVIGALFLKHKFSQSKVLSLVKQNTINTFILIATQAQEAKESNNPIYEGPLYENIEERETPLPTIHPQPLSLGRRMSRGLINGVDNVYQTSPIPIPSGEREGVYAELKTGGPHNTTAEEEDAYTIMSPVSRAATAINSTPYLEGRAAWIGNGK